MAHPNAIHSWASKSPKIMPHTESLRVYFFLPICAVSHTLTLTVGRQIFMDSAVQTRHLLTLDLGKSPESDLREGCVCYACPFFTQYHKKTGWRLDCVLNNCLKTRLSWFDLPSHLWFSQTIKIFIGDPPNTMNDWRWGILVLSTNHEPEAKGLTQVTRGTS